MFTAAGRLFAALLTISLMAGQAGLCAGWMPSAAARMECCEDGSCPMHKAEHPDADASRVITQAQADACCAAASSGHESNPSPPSAASAISVAVLGPVSIVPAVAPALVLSDSWRVLAPIPLASPPRHVLLSTFLI